MGNPKDFTRFIIQANACINHNAYDKLHMIKCDTLVIGADSDKIVGKNSSEEISNNLLEDLRLYSAYFCASLAL